MYKVTVHSDNQNNEKKILKALKAIFKQNLAANLRYLRLVFQS